MAVDREDESVQPVKTELDSRHIRSTNSRSAELRAADHDVDFNVKCARIR